MLNTAATMSTNAARATRSAPTTRTAATQVSTGIDSMDDGNDVTVPLVDSRGRPAAFAVRNPTPDYAFHARAPAPAWASTCGRRRGDA
ncbi:hypothetical protein GCM10009642_52540 [Nocardiopsis metallicus]